MSIPNFHEAIVVREADAEQLGIAQLSTRLLADGDATGGALSIMRTTMGEGIEGARPHTHRKSAEFFYYSGWRTAPPRRRQGCHRR